MAENRLLDVLHGKEENYILPFVWMHGAPENELRRLMQAVHESGIGAVCLEARPHPDFAGERWWHDVDIVLDEAVKRNMKVWILDDAHFPTGMANGGVVNQPRHLKRISLVEKHYAVTGPRKARSWISPTAPISPPAMETMIWKSIRTGWRALCWQRCAGTTGRC